MLQFENRYQAIEYYKKELFKVDQDLQDWLVHYEALKAKKAGEAMARMRGLNDLIDWQRSELKREHNSKTEVTGEW